MKIWDRSVALRKYSLTIMIGHISAPLKNFGTYRNPLTAKSGSGIRVQAAGGRTATLKLTRDRILDQIGKVKTI